MITLLWNGMGAMDYVMTQRHNEEYLSAYSPEQLDYFQGLPTWAVASWAIAVWGGVLGSLLLLLRHKLAAPVFLVSLLGVIANVIHGYVLSNGMEIMGDTFALVFNAAILLVALALYLYARSLGARGVLAG